MSDSIVDPLVEECPESMNEKALQEILQEIDGVFKGDDGPERASEFPEAQHLTDVGNGKRLIARNGEDLRFCHRWKKWLTWQGTRWVKDDSGEVARRAKQTVAGIYTEAARSTDEAKRKALAQWAARSESEARIWAMVSLAESEPGVPVAPAQLDADPWLLNCANGVLDLRTGELRSHRREDLLTKQVPVEYSPDARCQRWLDFLLEIMGGNLRLVAFLQRAVGYSLTGDVGEQVFFLLHGGGANGKSTFLESIKTVMGDYGAQADFGMFLSRRHASIPNDVARLAGARFVSALEAEAGKHLSESLVKSLTGGDTVAARFLYSEFFEYRPQFKLFLAANHKPVIKGTDLAIWRRIRLIPFAVTIPSERQDKNLSAKLRSELPGILTWAVQGCLAWQKHGLDVPGEVTAATESYRSEMDILGSFLAESCVQRPTATATAKQLYFAYVQWCEGNGEHPLGQRNFGMRLSERGFERRRGTGNVHIWHGIGLKTELGAFPELEE